MAIVSSTKESDFQADKSIQLGRMSNQPWRKTLHFVSPSYRAKAFWGLSGLGCIVFLWSVFQAFLAADVTTLGNLEKFSLNYSMVFTIFIGLLLAGLCVVICFQGVSLRVVEAKDDSGTYAGRLELRQAFKKPRSFELSTHRYTRVISNELSQATAKKQVTPSASQRSYLNALKNNSHTAVISINNATISFESQDIEALQSLKTYLDKQTAKKA